MRKVISLPLTAATVTSIESPSLERVVAGFGEFPVAVFDLTEISFNKEGAKLVARAFRAAEVVEPLPLADPIVLELAWEELRTVAGASALESAVRDAAWALLMSHPQLNRGTPNDPHNVFDGGELVEVE